MLPKLCNGQIRQSQRILVVLYAILRFDIGAVHAFLTGHNFHISALLLAYLLIFMLTCSSCHQVCSKLVIAGHFDHPGGLH